MAGPIGSQRDAASALFDLPGYRVIGVNDEPASAAGSKSKSIIPQSAGLRHHRVESAFFRAANGYGTSRTR
ncbi:hypothetical protein [Rhodococcus sp. IEGM 1379]|uniref:hypothetical protein n=1 Tax=Rhodococcus sp. IEGM 1379 TaxID=3047086 RepID=UPI0024B7CF12|nr:hypothetical protein [Rhodococcus sp. IEGM 1379]MDI9917721.1 hypothetical protein [Rhodococcus sp. IEGM 1379]